MKEDTAKSRKEIKNMFRMYLVEARQKKNLSMRKTALAAGMSVSHYSRIESGDRNSGGFFLTFCKIAEVLDINLNDMYRFEKEYKTLKESKETQEY